MQPHDASDSVLEPAATARSPPSPSSASSSVLLPARDVDVQPPEGGAATFANNTGSLDRRDVIADTRPLAGHVDAASSTPSLSSSSSAGASTSAPTYSRPSDDALVISPRHTSFYVQPPPSTTSYSPPPSASTSTSASASSSSFFFSSPPSTSAPLQPQPVFQSYYVQPSPSRSSPPPPSFASTSSAPYVFPPPPSSSKPVPHPPLELNPQSPTRALSPRRSSPPPSIPQSGPPAHSQSLSSRRSSSGTSGGGARPAFSLDLGPMQPTELEQAVFLDTPMPGTKAAEQRERAAAGGFNYFSANAVGVEKEAQGGFSSSSSSGPRGGAEGDPGGRGEGEGDGGDGTVEGGEGQPQVHDMFFEEDENLGYLEKIYLFARSKAVFHRVFIARALPEYLAQVSPAEAVEYVLPLLNGLGTDQDETVREAFVAQLVPVMWWFFLNCTLIEEPEDDEYDDEPLEQADGDGDVGGEAVSTYASTSDSGTYVTAADTLAPSTSAGSTATDGRRTPTGTQSGPGGPKLLVGTFTPLLGSLLLSQNVLVGEVARNCVVELLRRVHSREGLNGEPVAVPAADGSVVSPSLVQGATAPAAQSPSLVQAPAQDNPLTGSGHITEDERQMIENELIHGVIIALARLGQVPEDEEDDMGVGMGMDDDMAMDELDEALRAQQDQELSVEQFSLGPAAPEPEPAAALLQLEVEAPTPTILTPRNADGTLPDGLINSYHSDSSSPAPAPAPPSSTPESHSSTEAVYSVSPTPTPTGIGALGAESTPFTSSPAPLSTEVTSPGRSSVASPTSTTSTDRSTPSLQTSISSSESSATSSSTSLSTVAPDDQARIRDPFDQAAEAALLAEDEPHIHADDQRDIEDALATSSFGSDRSSSSGRSDATVTAASPTETFMAGVTIHRGVSEPMPGILPWVTGDSTISPATVHSEIPNHFITSPSSLSDPEKTPRVERSLSDIKMPLTSVPEGQLPLFPPFFQDGPSNAAASVDDDSSTTSSDRAPSPAHSEPILRSHSGTDVPDSGAPLNAGGEANQSSANAEDPGTSDDEAGVGKVASMSLIATVAATGKDLPEDVKGMFVAEVARVGTDPIYWVRREAAYALGALAKIVDEEMLMDYLVPMYDSFVGDSSWQVRQSALYALPPILGRLSPDDRRDLALANFQILTRDKSRSVRCGMLEILGEVIHTFINDEGGPPSELLRIFIGSPPEGYRLDPPPAPPPPPPPTVLPPRLTTSAPSTPGVRDRPKSKRGLLARDPSVQPLVIPPPDPETSGIDPVPDLDRPLICAFNFPAVALTVGPARWHEVSHYYNQLLRDFVAPLSPSTSPTSSAQSISAPVAIPPAPPIPRKVLGKVRRTLAASLGEMARILGPSIARDHLLPVFWASLYARAPPPAQVTYGFMGTAFATPVNPLLPSSASAEAEAEDARTKVLECIILFVESLALEEREVVARGLETAWKEYVRGWREREVFARMFGGLAGPLAKTPSGPDAMRKLCVLAVTDNVAAVREEAIAQLPSCIEGLGVSSGASARLRADILELAMSGSFRRRATYVRCTQSLVLSPTLGSFELSQDTLWSTLFKLASDTITDVRIGTARLVSLIAYQHYPDRKYPPPLLTLIRTLRDDATPEVSSFVRFLTVSLPQPVVLPVLQPHPQTPFATFSNPPFFGVITSPFGEDEAEEYFDALDVESGGDDDVAPNAEDDNRHQVDEEAPVVPAQLPSPRRRASNPQPIPLHLSPPPTIIPQALPAEQDPFADPVERPPIYRVWSY